MTVQALYDEFQKKCALDPELRALKQKIESGSADFNDTAAYSQRVSKLLGKTLSKHIDSIPASQREKICKWLLQEQYKDTNSICEVVQMALDEAQGIHLKPVKPKFPAERVEQVAHALEDPTVKPEVIQRRANAPVANVSMSFHDDYIKENAKIRAKLGMKPTITRYGSGCCSWCSAVAGKYRFGDQPKDIFRRHDNCDCTIIYDNQVLRGRETSSGRSKTWEEVDPKSVEALGFTPTVHTQEQAKKLQEIMMNGLTEPGQGSIIEDRRTGIILNTNLYHGEVIFRKITDERIKHIAPLEIDSLSRESNQQLTKGCKDILDYMRNETLGREGAIVFDMNMSEIDRYMSERVASSVPAKTYTESCIVLHNHPSDTLLSDDDLFQFYEHDEYKILGAVGHNGSTYFVEKTNEYDAFGFWDFMEECKLDFPSKMSSIDRVKYVEKVMKGANEYGVRVYTSIYPQGD